MIEYQANTLDRFLYWIKERHNIYVKRQMNSPPPWTNDEVLQRYFFTNPYRENDKVTVWFREHMREPLGSVPVVSFSTLCFRWFNWIPTGRILLRHKLHIRWNSSLARELLKAQSAKGEKVFTAAFIIKAYNGMSKIDGVCTCIDNVWEDRESLYRDLKRCKTMKDAHARIKEYPYMGPFMAYEIVCDLRHTHFLCNAPDICDWTNLGPGGRRGLRRVLGMEVKESLVPDWPLIMSDLLRITREQLPDMPHFEMREIEHSLCEFDKYERARYGEGHMKRNYNGKGT